jgi:hypothetical protein
MWFVWFVLDSGRRYEEFVLAYKSVDACVILGDRVRAEHGVPPGGSLGTIFEVGARPATKTDRAMDDVINPDGPFAVD